MGNERSALKGLEIDSKAVEITDFWTHHTSSVQGSNPQSFSVFISEPTLHSDASFGKPSPLEKAAKVQLNELINILKIIAVFLITLKFFRT